jgi:hypothetical protein
MELIVPAQVMDGRLFCQCGTENPESTKGGEFLAK